MTASTHPIRDDLLKGLRERLGRNFAVHNNTAILREGLNKRQRVQLHIRIAVCKSFECCSDYISCAVYTCSHYDAMLRVTSDFMKLTLALRRPRPYRISLVSAPSFHSSSFRQSSWLQRVDPNQPSVLRPQSIRFVIRTRPTHRQCRRTG